jgi:arsenate reductase (thioredoxin)
MFCRPVSSRRGSGTPLSLAGEPKSQLPVSLDGLILVESGGVGLHRLEVRSAGSTPADEINRTVRTAMAEIGIDLDGAHPKLLTTDAVQALPRLGPHRPRPKTLDQIRPIRDNIDQRVRELLTQLTLTTAQRGGLGPTQLPQR